jgi:type IV pilus assembly protein PilO
LKFEGWNNIPKTQQLIIFVMVLAAIIGVFIYFVYIPKNNEMTALNDELSKLGEEIRFNEAKAARIEELKRENARLHKQLADLKDQLPLEAEIAPLLKQVSDLGIQTGLRFKLWRPADRRQNASGLYIEVPVNVEVAGGYHAIATFFDRIGRMPRIVNISNLKMSTPMDEKGHVTIQTTFDAIAFAAVPGGGGGEGAGGPAKAETKKAS